MKTAFTAHLRPRRVALQIELHTSLAACRGHRLGRALKIRQKANRLGAIEISSGCDKGPDAQQAQRID
jgi:hypothetical protein